MAKPPGAADRKPIRWVGSSEDDICDVPSEVRIEFGRRLNLAQRGRMPPHTKALQGQGAGVFQMSESSDSGTYRAVYLARFSKAIYVLHVFQKKAKSGVKTDKKDIDAIGVAVRSAEESYKIEFGEDE